MDYKLIVKELEDEKKSLDLRIIHINRVLTEIEQLQNPAVTQSNSKPQKNKVYHKTAKLCDCKRCKSSREAKEVKGKKKKYTDEFFEVMKDQVKYKTLPELVKVCKVRFNIDIGEHALYLQLYNKGIKLQKKRAIGKANESKSKKVIRAVKSDTEKPDNPGTEKSTILTNDMKEELKYWMKENRGLSDKTMVKEIENKFGPDLGLRKVQQMRRNFSARYKSSEHNFDEDKEPEEELELGD